MEDKFSKPTRPQIPTFPITIWEDIKCGVFPQAAWDPPTQIQGGSGDSHS